MRSLAINLPSTLDLKHIEQFFGAWCMMPTAFDRLERQIGAIDLNVHVADHQARTGSADDSDLPRYRVDDGVAVIEITGTLTKRGGSLSQGYIQHRQALRAAAADRIVTGIMLSVDSPGGGMAGCGDLGDDIRQIRDRMPVHAYIDDLAASAGYWIVSQASQITINPTGKAGSIGVYAVVSDYSALDEKRGIKTHVIRSTDLKGAGAGDEITDAQLAEFQRSIDDAAATFVAAVAAGRKISTDKAAAWADARMWSAAEAKARGLVDHIGRFEQAMDRLRTAGDAHARTAGHRPSTANGHTSAAGGAVFDLVTQANGQTLDMHESSQPVAAEPVAAATPETETPDHQEPPMAAASLKELKTALPKSDAAFRESCLEADMSIEQAKDKWLSKVEADLEASQAQTAQAKADADAQAVAAAEAEKAKATKPGVQPLTSSKHGSGGAGADTDAGSATDRWNAAIADQVKLGKSKPQAVAAVARQDPDLRQAYVDEYNATRHVA